MRHPATEQASSPAPWLLRGYCVLVASCLLVVSFDTGPTLRIGAYLMTGVLTTLAMAVGPRLHRSPDQMTWAGLLILCLLFILSSAVRLTLGDTGPLALIPHLLNYAGYVIAIALFVRLLRGRDSRGHEALLDVTVVALAAVLLSVSFVVVPSVAVAGWLPWAVSAYPVLDVALLALLILLAFTARERNLTLRLIAACIVCLLIGDVITSKFGRTGAFTSSTLWDALYLLSYGLLGAAALHPSMASFGAGRSQQVQPWSWQRLAILVPALMVPGFLMLSSTPFGTSMRLMQAVGTAALFLAVLVRASRAVRQQSESRRVFEHLANHDALTDLANRKTLNDALETMLSHGRAVNVLFIDLDGFKLINDSWGHAVGDELLVQVAERMRQHLPPDVLLSRAGGDEFILVTPTRHHDPGGTGFAQHVIAELSQSFSLSVGEVTVTPSIGVASSSNDGDLSAEVLVRDADTAMYRAKDAGRSRVVAYDPSMGEIVRGRVQLDRSLRQALGRGEMDVHFQPVIELATGRLAGFEALARWHRSDDGPCTPDVFIAAAEENGLILPIGDFVLGRALDQLRRWRQLSPSEIGVNVNVSGRQLEDPGFTGRVLAALAHRGLPPSALRLEVTESTLVGDDSIAVGSLHDLERAGISVSVDDFGTGYSSLSYLSKLRVHEVKIDRSFVAGLTTRPEDHAIVRATAAMADALGLQVVAEGIETRDQRDALVELGVGRGQGWYLGRPMPSQQAADLVSSHWQQARILGA